jgi:hypothetical protein
LEIRAIDIILHIVPMIFETGIALSYNAQGDAGWFPMKAFELTPVK